ncbi:histidine phosphatase family protein [Paenibacillus sp. FA6]|uniref:histidine phosphatase family protein n=1 Tax=Paenibacillus sp. FA6 TaxID=3413029 RepID=UPI003F65D901
MKRIYLVRHCKAVGQDPQAVLTEEGNQQAEDLADFFQNENIEYIISSPFIRTINTIKPLSVLIKQNIYIEYRLQERILSTTLLENWMELLERTYSDYDLKFEGGESSNEAVKRGMKVIQDMIARPEGTILIVTHGALMSLIIRHYNKEFGFEDWKTLSNPDIYKLEIQDNKSSIERIWR